MSVNIKYIDQVQHLLGIHRSGWTYVMEQLEALHADDGIWCDTFVDRTFLFNTNPKVTALIPYTVPWIGFVHHPFDAIHSSCDSGALVESTEFQGSLKMCKGLFVFGAGMEQQWRAALAALGHVSLPVFNIVHPTETPGQGAMFSVEKLKANEDPYLVQVGAHLRDTYAIFALNKGITPVGAAGLHKAALVGPNMSAYYVAESFFDYLVYAGSAPQDAPQGPKNPVIAEDERVISSVNAQLPDSLLQAAELAQSPAISGAICRTGTACRNSFNNVYVVGALRLLKQYDLSVALLPTLDNDAYDKLLSENVVFVQLFESATTAINTVLECIVRNTPIVVNRTPATLELLGAEYPLFYDDLDEIPALISLSTIGEAHTYLATRVPKDQFTGKAFIAAFKIAMTQI